MLNQLFKIIDKLTPAKYRWLLNHEGFRRYFANTGWMFFGQMFSLLASFFVGAWLARYLGPENYGVINYAIAFACLFGFVASLGVDSLLIRELVKTPEKRDELMGTSFGLKLIGGLSAFAITAAAAFLLETAPLNRTLIIIFAFSSIIQAINVISSFFQARVEAKNNVRAQIIAGLISAALKIVFILAGANLAWLMVIFTLDGAWQAIIFVLTYRAKGYRLRAWRFDRGLARRLWHDSWLLMLSSAASFILLKIDQVMIGQMMGERAVGLYAAAVKFVEIWYFIPVVICASLFPAIVNAKKTSSDLYRRRLRNFYFLMIMMAVLIAVPTVILAPWAVNLLFGAAYAPAVLILQIYVWSGVGLFWGWAINQQLTAENRTRTIFILNFAAMILNIGLNLVLIPALGLPGAALATLISYFAIPVLMIFFRKGRREEGGEGE